MNYQGYSGYGGPYASGGEPVNRPIQQFAFQRGGDGKTMGGWQDASGERGVGAGIKDMWWGSDLNKLKHAGKDLRATAMQWVPQLLESTPEAQTLFNEEEYLDMIRPQVEQAIGQMMGGYRTSMENIRRGMAARGLSASGLAEGIGAEASGQMRAQTAGLENQAISQAKMQRLQQALQYRQNALALGLGVPQPMHQNPKPKESSGWGQVAGTVLGAAAGGLAAGAAGSLFSSGAAGFGSGPGQSILANMSFLG